jgi:hypothetical protein
MGITVNEWRSVEDEADDRLTDNCGQVGAAPPDAFMPMDKIPSVFTGLDSWPAHSNLRCWSCTFTFDGRPSFVPTYLRENASGGLEVGVLGNTCTFNCAELMIETSGLPPEERQRMQENLCVVYFLFTGHHVTRIKPAPPKTKLHQYGGEWDEETFWKKLRELDPAHGLRDHTPGSVVPERERVQMARASFCKNGWSQTARVVVGSPSTTPITPGTPIPVGTNSVWKVCGLPNNGLCTDFDSLDSVGVTSLISSPVKVPLSGGRVTARVAARVKQDLPATAGGAPSTGISVGARAPGGSSRAARSAATDDLDSLIAEVSEVSGAIGSEQPADLLLALANCQNPALSLGECTPPCEPIPPRAVSSYAAAPDKRLATAKSPSAEPTPIAKAVVATKVASTNPLKSVVAPPPLKATTTAAVATAVPTAATTAKAVPTVTAVPTATVVLTAAAMAVSTATTVATAIAATAATSTPHKTALTASAKTAVLQKQAVPVPARTGIAQAKSPGSARTLQVKPGIAAPAKQPIKQPLPRAGSMLASSTPAPAPAPNDIIVASAPPARAVVPAVVARVVPPPQSFGISDTDLDDLLGTHED